MTTRKAEQTKPEEALQILIDDHRKVQKMFSDFKNLEEEDEEQQEALIALTCAALKAHTRLEEELVYPEMRDALSEKEGPLVDEAEIEHEVAKDLIARLQTDELDPAHRRAAFTVLGEYIAHHIKEEEEEMFPQFRKSKVDLAELGERMVTRLAELEEEIEQEDEVLLAMEDEDEAGEDDERQRSRKQGREQKSGKDNGADKRATRASGRDEDRNRADRKDGRDGKGGRDGKEEREAKRDGKDEREGKRDDGDDKRRQEREKKQEAERKHADEKRRDEEERKKEREAKREDGKDERDAKQRRDSEEEEDRSNPRPHGRDWGHQPSAGTHK